MYIPDPEYIQNIPRIHCGMHAATMPRPPKNSVALTISSGGHARRQATLPAHLLERRVVRARSAEKTVPPVHLLDPTNT